MAYVCATRPDFQNFKWVARTKAEMTPIPLIYIMSHDALRRSMNDPSFPVKYITNKWLATSTHGGAHVNVQ